MNSWEKNARNAKRSALIAALLDELGPLTPAACAQLADRLRRFTRIEWSRLAARAGCNPPTFRAGVSLTADQVVDYFLDRAAGKVTSEPEPPDFSRLRGDDGAGGPDVDRELEALEAAARMGFTS